MPHRQKHRGAHASDCKLFSEDQWPELGAAVNDLSWLLSRGYTEKAALKLVGDRYALKSRQRNAVFRCACSDRSLIARLESQCPAHSLQGREVIIDGFNLIITIEAALSGGAIFEGRDGCFRDIASVHGSYRKVEETEKALLLTGHFLRQTEVKKATWLLDQPVSNSGRLRQLLLEMAAANDWPWAAELAANPDEVLKNSKAIVASSDGVVLDAAERWTCLSRLVIEKYVPEAWVIRAGSAWEVEDGF